MLYLGPNDGAPMGGTEILKNGLYKHTKISEYNDINIMLSTPTMKNIKFTKKNILWQHLSYDDPSLGLMKDTTFLNSIQAFVYVSNWQYEKYRYIHQIPTKNAFIIKNATEPIEFLAKEKNEKIKLIYTSTPFRGLDILLSAFELLDRDDVELDVYSSTIIYGKDYEKHHVGLWDKIIEKAKSTKNVNYYGYASNEKIKKALQQAHIFAYPSTFEETCCLAMIEAGAAGCKMVTTNLGALYETGSEFATMIPIQSNIDVLIKNYAKVLNQEIDNYWSTKNQNMIKQQSDFYNTNYSWSNKSQQWNSLFNYLT
jgi:glycosyltransferase involved in cell wall biosynthesis